MRNGTSLFGLQMLTNVQATSLLAALVSRNLTLAITPTSGGTTTQVFFDFVCLGVVESC